MATHNPPPAMSNEEIKDKCEMMYAVIRMANKELTALRKECSHEHTHEGLYEWGGPGRISPARICDYCNEPVEWLIKPMEEYLVTTFPPNTETGTYNPHEFFGGVQA